ncbi:hypothetical protein BOTBODRAFT_175116 [Botryobasidium botryosum FD-172 SS1]|uniref:Uncharacterized protein n=1 Tax=Botryobasidium botryosum (strain FD-172 SS1) TaxID=930990 RepID=A0A067ME02_BOTB1|nr:hypothetical protein BOTBODRAFT_175116 [Botryobasidium botryosum FD-172 SS1]
MASGFRTYLTPLLSALALTSLSFNLLVHRRNSAYERSRLTAQTTILESLVSRMRSGERVEDAEIERLLKLGRGEKEGEVEGGADRWDGRVGWKDVLFGRKPGEAEDRATMKEWEEAIASAEASSSPQK